MRAETSKNEDTWYGVLGEYSSRIRYNPESIQGVVAWAAFYMQPQLERQLVRPLPVLQRRQVELELQLARQRLERQQSCGCCGGSNLLHFSPDLVLGEFCLA